MRLTATRLRNWMGVILSIVLMASAGAVGVLVNRSALRAADLVHRADSRALGTNNATLAGEMQLLSAKELYDFGTDHRLALTRDSRADRDLLAAYAGKSSFFTYGVAVTDLTGRVLTATRASGLPPASDPAFDPLRAELAAGRPGFTALMSAGGAWLSAVGVPVLSGDLPVAVLIGFNEVASGQLQGYVAKLSSPGEFISVIDGGGRVVAATDRTRIGTVVVPEITDALRLRPTAGFLSYDAGGTPMIAVVAAGLPGGWSYLRIQTEESFNGVVRSRSQTTNLVMIVMLVIGLAGFGLLGYRTQATRRRADERFRALIQHAPDMVAVLDERGRITYDSPSAAAGLGLEHGVLLGTSVFDVVHPDDRDRLAERFAELLEQREGVIRLQCRVPGPGGGAPMWFDFTASNQLHNPSLSGVVINARDISESRALHDRLTREAEHDPLTGLPNRRRMRRTLDASLGTGPVTVLLIDLDGFKPVNDCHGHEAGDQLLRQVADRLTACVRDHDVVSRIGGDEFVVLLPGVHERVDAELMAARLRRELERPFAVAHRVITIAGSVGVHLAARRDQPDEALRRADDAMYAVKQSRAAARR